MENLWSLHILVVLVSVDAAFSHQSSQGLSCENDFVNNVSCTWNGSSLAPGVNCWISGVKETRIRKNGKKHVTQMTQTCKLEPRGNSNPGCSFVFENKEFSRFKDLPYIRLECNGTLVENLTNYKPCHHIKMHPPGAPSVNTTANETWISWSAGSPISIFIRSFNFQVQIKQKNQAWKEARTLFTQELKQKIPSWKLKGHCQVRVRVYPTDWPNSHWSNWSPTTSWVGPTDTVAASLNQEGLLDQTSLLIWAVMFSFGLVVVVMLLLYRKRMSKGLHKEKPAPNPSKYFHALHSVHGGNLKTWLNPRSAPESFFTAQPRDHISTVELCDSSDAPASSSCSTTSTLLHSQSYPSTSSGTCRVTGNCSSSSSSSFSNMAYFLSSSSCSSARTETSLAYFTYQDEFHRQPNSHNLHLSLLPSCTTTPTYESLNREPQSPDSGFGIGEEDEEDKTDKTIVDAEVLHVHETSPLIILPLHLPHRMSSTSSSPLPPTAPSQTQASSHGQQVDTPVAAAGSSSAGRSLAGTMGRSSSMPVEPSKTGYLTLKELQTTFSNKSI